MILGDFPNHDSSQAMVADITDLGLAGPLVIVGNKHIIGRTCIADTDIGGLGAGVPVVKVALIVARHDCGVSRGGYGRRVAPRLPWLSDPSRCRARTAAPDVSIKGDADT